MLDQSPRCTYIKVTGHNCQSPALKGKNFCYFHERVMRRVAIPYETTIEPQFILDNEASIQYALMETLTAIVRGTMDHKTAALVLRGLHIAVRNCHNKTHFDHHRHEMVREVPNYARQYLLEHPELGAPITDEEVEAELQSTNEILEQEIQQPAQSATPAPETLETKSATPDRIPPSPDHQPMPHSTEMPTTQASATTLSSRQKQQWKEVRRLQSSYEGCPPTVVNALSNKGFRRLESVCCCSARQRSVSYQMEIKNDAYNSHIQSTKLAR